MSSTPPPFVRGFDKNRLEALIDGIFAVALTLLVLDIKLPETIAYADNDALWARLWSLERHFVIYIISIIVIGMYWIAHHTQFHFLRYTDRSLIWINMLTLLVVGLLKRRVALFIVVPLLSMLVAFYSTRFSLYVYALLMCAHFFPGRIDEHIHTTPGGALSSKDP